MNPRKSVIRRHILEQHSGFGFRCNGCQKIFCRPTQPHDCPKYPAGGNGILMNRLTGASGVDVEADYETFKRSVDANIKANHVPAPVPSDNLQKPVKRASSEPAGFKKPKAKGMRAASTVAGSTPGQMISPLARVEPPPEKSYVATRPITPSKGGDAASGCVNSGDADLPRPGEASRSRVPDVPKNQPTVEEKAPADSVSESGTHHSVLSEESGLEDGEIEVGDRLSLSVGPAETLSVANMPSPPAARNIRLKQSGNLAAATPPATPQPLTSRFNLAHPADTPRRVAKDIQQSIVEVKLGVMPRRGELF